MADTVTVLCRLPSGIRLDLHDLSSLSERTQATAPVMTPPQARSSILLNGIRQDPLYHPVENRLLGRAGRTPVPTNFWKAWLEQNRQSDLITRKIIFAETTPARADNAMAELAKDRTGLEGADNTTLAEGVTPMQKTA
ncbi:hypothetical protein [Bombella apis]|uniref:hypothetical protein n=1 Tax=Bombella apis TaxID=1785988 RepID=UPI0023F18564|nr:hypothetical protein [Bombella apis]MCT6814206.1 hypothetical protein [Bombella apis]MCT6820355.1 hypothetical protein [Bombella apis]MCT6846079.1 hypothetical protein [Bombella apis]